jgi:Anti-sigma-K factor rskA
MAEPGSPKQPDDALLHLLSEQVTAGLSPKDARALDVLDDAVAAAYLQDLEGVAAAVNVALSAPGQESLPPALRARIEHDAQIFFGKDNASPLSPCRERVPVSSPPAKRTSAAGWLAVAACLTLALLGWLRPDKPATAPPTTNVAATVPVITPPARAARAPRTPPSLTLAQERTAPLARPDVISRDLGAAQDPAAAGVNADIVWDPTTQRGFVHIVGLKPNDPQIQQYQAWVFDAHRDKRYPITVGLFDAPADSTEVVVPIHSDLPVQSANAFAVTLKRSGGVVVPALHHVIVLGKVT